MFIINIYKYTYIYIYIYIYMNDTIYMKKNTLRGGSSSNEQMFVYVLYFILFPNDTVWIILSQNMMQIF